MNDDNADIVGAAGAVSCDDKLFHCMLWIVRVSDYLGQRFRILNHFPKAITAQEKAVAHLQSLCPKVNFHFWTMAQRACDDIAARMAENVFRGQLAITHQLRDVRVIFSQLLQLAIAQQVGATVAHVGNDCGVLVNERTGDCSPKIARIVRVVMRVAGN